MATILAIDDSTSILAWLDDGLSSAGHRVITSGDGRQGEKLLRESKVDVIITDIYMPERDGLEVIQYARRLAPGVKVIAISGAAPELDMLAAARVLGATRTLKKPFSLDQLLETITDVLGLPKGLPSPETSDSGSPPRSASRQLKKTAKQCGQPKADVCANTRGRPPGRAADGQPLKRSILQK